MLIRKYIVAAVLLTVFPVVSLAQDEGDFRSDDDFRFDHLSVGATVGTTGLGASVAMPVNRQLSLRTGLTFMSLGRMKISLPITLGQIYSLTGSANEEFDETMCDEDIGITIQTKIFTGNILLDYHPWRTTGFHLTGGVFLGNRNIAHFYNNNYGGLKSVYVLNNHVHDYNEAFGTNYPDVGVRFGDYIFTADEEGNIDVQMKVWAVRPYLGIGWGRNINTYRKRAVIVNFDCGCQFWGEPEFTLNRGEKVVKSTSSDAGGLMKVFSGFQAMPVLQLRISGDLY